MADKEQTLRKIARVCIILGSAFGLCSLVLFIPQVREFIIQLGEKYVGRSLTHPVWHKKLIGEEIKFLVFDFLFLLASFYIAFLQHTRTYLEHFLIYGGIYFLALIVFSFKIKFSGDDTSYFCKVLDNQDLVSFLAGRYHSWTSRLFTEMLLVNFARNIYIFRLVNFIVQFSIFFSLKNLLDIKSEKQENIFLQFALLLYPLNDMSTAGWCATLMNYLWALSALLYVLSFTKNICTKSEHLSGKFRFIRKIIFVPALLYTLNVEQTAGILFLVMFVILLKNAIKNHKVNIFCCIIFVLTLLALMYIFTCPGNAARKISETRTWLPIFAEYTLLDKLYAGCLLSFDVLIANKLFLFVLSAILLKASFKKSKNSIYRSISLVPFIIILWYILYPIVSETFPDLVSFCKIQSVFIKPIWEIDKINWYSLKTYRPPFILSIVLIPIYVQIIILNVRQENFLIISSIPIIGFISLLILGFSPTVFASGVRTAIFLYFSLLILILGSWKTHLNEKEKVVFTYMIGILGVLNYLNVIV